MEPPSNPERFRRRQRTGCRYRPASTPVSPANPAATSDTPGRPGLTARGFHVHPSRAGTSSLEAQDVQGVGCGHVRRTAGRHRRGGPEYHAAERARPGG